MIWVSIFIGIGEIYLERGIGGGYEKKNSWMETGIHFEKNDKQFNHKITEYFENKKHELEEKIGEKLIFQKEWLKKEYGQKFMLKRMLKL